MIKNTRIQYTWYNREEQNKINSKYKEDEQEKDKAFKLQTT